MGRVSFKSKKIRDDFFRRAMSVYGFSRWNDFSKNFGVSRKVLGQYRCGSLTLPLDLYEKISGKFSSKDVGIFSGGLLILGDNWGKIKGGRNAYLKNKIFFDEGREKAILFSKKRVKKFDINLSLTEDLAYFIGLFIGDGFTNKYQRYYLTQFVGQCSSEKEYYEDVVSEIGWNLFGIVPKIREEKGVDAVRVNYYSRDLFRMITERFGISRGRKSYDVLIPNEVLNSSEENVLACVAGLYDAEGCFYFVDKKGYKRPYPVLEFHVNNVGLVEQVSEILNNVGIKNSAWKKRRVVVYGRKSVGSFFRKVKVRSPKLLEKVSGEFLGRD